MQTLKTFIKKIFVASLLLSSFSLFAQNCPDCDEEINYGGDLIRCENFEAAANNAALTTLSFWTSTAGNVTASANDKITYQGNRSAKFEFKPNSAMDMTYKFGNPIPDFDFHLATKLFIPVGKSARISFLDNSNNVKYIVDFGKNDTAFVKATPNGAALASFRYPKGAFFRFSNMIRPTTKRLEVFIGGKQTANVVLPNPTIAIPNQINFKATQLDAEFSVDNICFVRNKKVGFVANCSTVTKAFCVGGGFNDLTNECTLGSEGGYIPLEYSEGICSATLGCVATCPVGSGCYTYYISKDGKIFANNNFCQTAATTEWSVYGDVSNYSFANGMNKNSKDIVISPSKSGVYTIVEKIFDATGNLLNSCSQNINYNPSLCNEPPIINVQYQTLGNGRFLISTTNSQNIDNISWKAVDAQNKEIGAVIISGSNTAPEIIKPRGGIARLVATASNECGAATTVLEINDNTCQSGCPNAIDQTANIKPSVNGKLVTFTGLPTSTQYAYNWKVVGFSNIAIPTVANPTINLPDFGTYTICCEITKTNGACINRASYCFNVKAEDDTQCFDGNCNEIRFYQSGNAAKPLEYTFISSGTTPILSWKVKNLKTNQVVNIVNTSNTLKIDFSDVKYGGASDYAVAYKTLVGGTPKCCGVNIKAENPFTCGNTSLNYEFLAATNSYKFSTPTQGAIFLVENGTNEPFTINNGVFPLPTNSAPLTISYKVKNAASGIWTYCSKKIFIGNPFECQNIDISYKSSGKTLFLGIKNAPTGASGFTWTEDETNKTLANAQSINYPLPIATPCTGYTYSLRYFDGQNWILCSQKISNCDPDLCATSIQHSYSANTSNGQLVLTTNLSNVSKLSWFIDDKAAQSVNKNIVGGKYKVSLLYFDENDKTYKICSKSIKVGDECFINTDCDQLKFFFNNDPTQPLRYTFSAITNGTVVQWRIKNVTTQKTVFTNSGNTQSLNFAQYGGEGEYIICYEYENAGGAEPSGCCCTKVCISNPYTCGDNNITYEYNANLNSFVFLYNGQVSGNGEWLQYVLGNNPNILPNGTFQIPAICGNQTIGFRFKDPISNCVKICYRTIYICNPFDCQNIKVGYSNSKNNFVFSLNNSVGTSKYNWKVVESATSLGTNATANYSFANAICDQRTVTVDYNDGQKSNLCAVKVFHCDPSNCETFIDENIVNNKFVSLSVQASFKDVVWYLNDKEVGGGNTFNVTQLTPNDYKIAALYFDPNSNYYRVCTKSFTINDECFVKSDCKEITTIYSGKFTGDLKYSFTVADAKGLLNWQVKKEGDPTPKIINSTNGTIEIDFGSLTGEGDYTICASKPNGCCCIKLAVINPLSCNDIDFKFNNSTKNFDFKFTGSPNITRTDWLDETGKVLSAPSYSTTPCATKIITFRYYDVTANIYRFCSKKVFVCNPLDCKNILLDYKPSTKTFGLNLVTIPAASNDFTWFLDDVSFGTGQSTTYVQPTPAPCKTQTFSVKYFDGEKSVICAVQIFVCNPDDCGDNVNFAYSKGKLDFATKASFTDAKWFINDNKAKEKGNDVVPGTYKATVFYFDNIEKYYRVCSKNIVLDDECFQDPTCDNLSFYQSGGESSPLIYTFVAQNITNITAWKFKKVGAATEVTQNVTTNTREIDFSQFGGAGEYIVCVNNANGCCCLKVKIENPFDCKNIDFQFDQATKNYNLFYKTSGFIKTQWLIEDPGKAPKSLNINALPLPATCVTRTVSYRYYDAQNKIWGYCSQNFYLCNPFECGDKSIFFTYDKTTGKDNFKFLLNDANLPTYKDLAWQVDGSQPTPLVTEPDKSTNYYPAPGQDCKPYVVSVKYFDTSQKVWRFCSIKVDICNPEKCNLINIKYKPSTKIFEFSVPAPANSKNFTWTIEDLQTIIGDQATTGYLLPSTLPCKDYTVAIRYYDGTSWRLCTRKISLCDPSKCSFEINYVYDFDDTKGDGKLTFSNSTAGLTNVKWFIDETPAQAINNGIEPGNYSFTVIYDLNGVTKICTRKVTLDGTLDKFTLSASKLSTAPGNDVVIDIRSRNFSNLAQYQFTVSWNPAIAKLKTPDKFITKGTTTFDVSQQNAGLLGVKWDATNAIIGESYPDNAILYKLNFNIVGKLGDETVIDFVDNLLNIKVTDNAGKIVPFTKVTGLITVKVTATNEVTGASDLFKLFPNPASHKATLSFDPAEVNVEEVALYDLRGQNILKIDGKNNNGKIDFETENFETGIYLIKIKTSDKIYIDKLMIMK